MLGAHHIIVNRWSFEEVERAISRFLGSVEAPTWRELASTKLSRLGHWEFEDYQEYVEQ